MEEEFRRLERENQWNLYFASLLEKSRMHSFQDADKSCNLPLNRYIDVKAYDRTRIKLLRSTDTDYINANEVSILKAGRRYILTQGPLNDTLGHFWLMIWEQKTHVIVMLNKIYEMEEFVKCEQYWPEMVGDNITFDDVRLSVTLKSIRKNNHYIVRELLLKDQAAGSTRTVLQFHYMAWPDHSEPTSPVSFLRLLAGVRKTGGLDKMDEPAVVHCSAGIGRSGTFCLIDSILTMIENQGSADSIDIGTTLLEMRDYRMGLIQSAIQLRFAYKSIIYGIKALEKAHKLRPHSSNRRQPTNGSPLNGPKRTVRIRKKSSNGGSIRSSLLVDALEDADSDTLEEAFDISMIESESKRPRSDSTNGGDGYLTSSNGPRAHSTSSYSNNQDTTDELSPFFKNKNTGMDSENPHLSPIDLDKVISMDSIILSQYLNNSSTSTNSKSDPKASSVLLRRREREIKLAEKTNDIKMKMKAEELRKEKYLYRMALLRKSAFYGGFAVALGAIFYIYLSDNHA